MGKREMLDPEKSLGAYLFRIGKNMAIDYFRRAKRDKALSDSFHFYSEMANDVIPERKTQADEGDLYHIVKATKFIRAKLVSRTEAVCILLQPLVFKRYS